MKIETRNSGNSGNSEIKRTDGNIAILLDLDSTLISSIEQRTVDASKQIYVDTLRKKLENFNIDDEFIVFIRPGVDDFLDFIGARFHVGVWTAASHGYGLPIIKHLFKSRRIDSFLFFNHCEFARNHYDSDTNLKPLQYARKVLGMKNIILIDDLEDNCRQPNAIKVEAFDVDISDKTLLQNNTVEQINSLVDNLSSDSQLTQIKKHIEDECQTFHIHKRLSSEEVSEA